MKPEYKPLMHIEIQNKKWYYSKGDNKIYRFDKGLFHAHTQHTCQGLKYSVKSTRKKLTSDARIIKVSEEDDATTRLTEKPTGKPTWSKVTEKSEIEEWLMHQNKKHVQQVHDNKSPFTQSPLSELIGPHGMGKQAIELLEGKYSVDEMDLPLHLKEWLKWLNQTEEEQAAESVPQKITPEMFSSAFKTTDEMTSSLPSHLHYTLWKAVAEQKTMSKCYSVMMSLPFQYAFAHPRWTTEMDVMLEKAQE